MMPNSYKIAANNSICMQKPRCCSLGNLIKLGNEQNLQNMARYTVQRTNQRMVLALHVQKWILLGDLYLASAYEHEAKQTERSVYV